MKMKLFVVAVTLSLLLSGMAAGVGREKMEKRVDHLETDIVLVPLEGDDDISSIESAGGEILHRYPNRALVEIPERKEKELRSRGIDIRSTLSRTTEVSVAGTQFDITESEPDLPEETSIERYEDDEKGQYIVNMIGPIASEWRSKIEDMDVDVINYLPNHAYRVMMTPEQAGEVSDLDFVDWVGFYHPEYRLQSDIEPGTIDIELLPGAEEETIKEIERVVTVTSAKELHDAGFTVEAEAEDQEELHELSNINEVRYISERAEVELHDEMATQIIGGGTWFYPEGWESDDGPYRNEDLPGDFAGDAGSYMNQLGYTGEDVVVAVADTGLGDETTPDAGHDDFTGRVIGGRGFGTTGWEDTHGHGTHVTGSAAGDTFGGTGEEYPGLDNYYAAQGSAPDSELYAQKIFDGGSVPDPVTELFEDARESADAYVHSNSWGSTGGHGEYTGHSPDFDASVRDANQGTEENEEMIITTAAGNDGEDGTPPPATAKNVIVIGATENYNSETDDPENMASFSSRGFTDDNRVKPDIVAPGSSIYSTDYDGDYRYMSGTSMSNPAVAGAAAVVVEWYEDKFGEKPSPAMVRSLLINTANPMDGDTRGPIPNEDEGWGMVDISKLERPLDEPNSFMFEDQNNKLETGEVDEHGVEVEDQNEPLKITLTWTDKEAGNVGSDTALINDLNLEVESPSGDVFHGNAFAEDGNGESTWDYTYPNTNAMSVFDDEGDGWDDTNNVQNVYIHPDDLESGVYTINVEGFEVPEDGTNDGEQNQDYALTMYNAVPEGQGPSIDLTRPDGGEVWEAGTEEEIEWNTQVGDDPIDHIDLYYSVDGKDTWENIASEVADTGNYTWQIPEKASEESHVRVVAVDEAGRTGENTSEAFTIQVIEQYDLDISIQGEGNTEPEEGTHTFEEDTVVTVEATPADNWDFTEWTGDHEDTEKEIEIIMDENKSVTAHFEIKTYSLDVEVEGDGSVDEEPNKTEYEHGETVNLTAIPGEGYDFVNWTGDYEGTDKEIEIVMDENKSLTAKFSDEVFFEVEVFEHDNEVVEGENLTFEYEVTNVGDLNGTQTVEFLIDSEINESISISLESGEIYTSEINWTAGYPYGERKLSMESEDDVDQVTTFVFSEEPFYDVEIDEPIEDQIFEKGENVTVEYEIFNYGTSEGEKELEFYVDNTLEQTKDVNISSNESHTGSFEWIPEEIGEFVLNVSSEDDSDEVRVDVTDYHELDVEIKGQGSVTIEPDKEEYEEVTEVTVEATPDEGWEFVEWTGDYEEEEKEITIIMDEDKEITAWFEEEEPPEEYELTINAEDGGTTDPDPGTYTYDEGEEIDVKAIPDEGWEFVEWEGDYEETDKEITISMNEDKEITAVFEEPSEEYRLTFVVEDELKETIEGVSVTLEGETVQTDVNGEAVFEDIEPKTYNYTVKEEGYETVKDQVTIVNEDVVEEITLEESAKYHDLTILVTDEEYERIEGAEVELNSTETEEIDYVETTNENGLAKFEDIPQSTYEYVVTHADYLVEEGMIELKEEFEKDIVLEDALILELEIQGSGAVNCMFSPEPVYENETEPGERWEFKLENGTVVELLPEPDEGWMFSEWKDLGGEYDEETGATEFIMTEDKDTTLVFVEEDEYHTLQIGAIWGQGTVEVDDEVIEAPFEREYKDGSEVELSATPEEYYEFFEWLERIDTGEYETFEEDSEITVVVEKDITLIPHFAHAVELGVIGEGEIIVEGRRTEDEEWVEHPDSPVKETSVIPGGESGDEIRLTAEPSEAYKFVEWDGYHEDEKEITFTLEENVEFTAVFEEEVVVEHHDILIKVEDDEPLEGAVVEVERVGNQTTNETGETTFESLAPDTYDYTVTMEGYELYEGNVTIVDEDVTELVILEEDVMEEYDLIFEVEDEDGDAIEEARIEINDMDETTDEDGMYTFTDLEPGVYEWEVSHDDYESEEGEIELTEDTTITVELEEYYELTVEIEGEGEVEVDPEQDEYQEGTEVELEAIPEEGWEFVEWEGDYEGTDEEITITMNQNMEIKAVFEESTYSLTFEVVDDDDEDPIEDAEIVLEKDDEEWEGETDEDGMYTFMDLEPGTYEWEVGYDDYETENGEVEIQDEDKTATVNLEQDEDVPGFTSLILLISVIIAVMIYGKKKNGNEL